MTQNKQDFFGSDVEEAVFTQTESVNRTINQDQSQADSSQEFLSKDDKAETKDAGEKSELHRQAEALARGYENSINQQKEEQDKILGSNEVEAKKVDFFSMEEKYNSIIQQSTELSQEYSKNIQIQDLGEECTQMILNATKEISQQADRSTIEKLIPLVPTKTLQNKLSKYLDVASMELQRGKNVKEFAQKHFDMLYEKGEIVKTSRLAIHSIKEKLANSNEILLEMKNEAEAGLLDITQNGGSKADEIQGKEMLIKINHQLIQQNQIIDNTQIFEEVAQEISKRISSTLPQIRTQFLDVAAINIALQNLTKFKKSVDSTNLMVSKMQSDSLNQMTNIMEDFAKNGLGDTAEQRKEKELIKKKRENLYKISQQVRDNREADVNRDLVELEKQLLEDEHRQQEHNKFYSNK